MQYCSLQHRTLLLSPGGCGQRTKHRREKLSHVQGQGQRPRVPVCDGAGMAERSHPTPEAREAAGRSNPTPEARGGGQEEQPHVQGAVAGRVQAGLEELFHVQGQEGRR